MLDLNTFSIVARDRRTGDLGVAVATARPAVGSLVPWVSAHGAIATQARTSTDHGRHGLALLAAGLAIEAALPALLAHDPDRDIRQVHGVDAERAFAHTGARCVAWCGHRTGAGFSVAGNMLVGPEVLDAMVEAFTAAAAGSLELSERLLCSLEAGQAAGGDRRGKQSAALLVASATPEGYHNLRVDDHVEPVAELRRIYDLVVAHARKVEQEYGAEGRRLFGRVKL